jgi:hypothetical protein
MYVVFDAGSKNLTIFEKIPLERAREQSSVAASACLFEARQSKLIFVGIFETRKSTNLKKSSEILTYH